MTDVDEVTGERRLRRMAWVAVAGTIIAAVVVAGSVTWTRIESAGHIHVSGDATGASGDEVAAMTAYLRERGVPAYRIVADPYGLDSYDTCARAVRVYGIRRALLVTQAYHLPRAVTLCRRLGIDAHGVQARCAGCRVFTRAVNIAREGLADVKAVGDALRHRPAKVDSPPDPAVTNALR